MDSIESEPQSESSQTSIKDEKDEVPAKPGPRRSTRKKLNKPIINDRMTPMGLPKPTRMDKTATVSVEDLYLQKNYRTPKTTSALPTIFDENDPKRKKGLMMSKAKRKREIVFQTDPSLRKSRVRKGAKRGLKRKFDDSEDSMDLLRAKLAKLDEEISQDEELKQ